VAELDARVPETLQRQMLAAGGRLMAHASRWLLRNGDDRIRIDERIDRYRPRIDELVEHLPDLVDEVHRASLEALAAPLEDGGVPPDLAGWAAGFDILTRALDLVEAAEACGVEMSAAAQVYFQLGSDLELHWLARHIHALPTHDRWVAGARAAYRDDLLEHHRALCITVLAGGLEGASPASRLETWRRRHHKAVEAWLTLVSDLKAQDTPDLAMLSVALRALRKLATSAASHAEPSSREVS
jgi:glutamate dehydrogenase